MKWKNLVHLNIYFIITLYSYNFLSSLLSCKINVLDIFNIFDSFESLILLRSTKILIKWNFCLEMYIPYILKMARFSHNVLSIHKWNKKLYKLKYSPQNTTMQCKIYHTTCTLVEKKTTKTLFTWTVRKKKNIAIVNLVKLTLVIGHCSGWRWAYSR